MMPIRKALELAEDFLERRYWVHITTFEDCTVLEAGPIYSDGFRESPTHHVTFRSAGEPVITQWRI